MTTHARKEDEESCLAAGMDAYISKPIDFKACLLLIETSLKKPLSLAAGKQGRQILDKKGYILLSAKDIP